MAELKSYSIPTLKRLPGYLRELRRLRRDGVERVASPALGRALQIDSISARKDLEAIGAAGSPGVGYRVEELIERIEGFLGWKNVSEAFIIGVGELGSALLGYSGLASHGLRIVAAFDHRGPVRPGKTIHDVPVFGLEELAHLAHRLRIRMAILCVPDDEAQETADLLVKAGIVAIWNFTAQTLETPPGIIRQNVNLAGDFAVLSVKLAQRLDEIDRVEQPEDM
ncbi:MAG: redox-sensing transcriptional repressor Rex [Victivallaceae bacterium]|nr:redox-sensing transcriptional repressor Rex [Victivallaceae bacterium]